MADEKGARRAATETPLEGKGLVHAGLVSAIAAALRAGDTIGTVAARSRNAARGLVSGAMARVAHVAAEVRPARRRGRDVAGEGTSDVEEAADEQQPDAGPSIGAAPSATGELTRRAKAKPRKGKKRGPKRS
ncbi:MAG TPA: hypothetical protein VMS64_38260 [Candidatus Methylomirabilis sp.]|nr:hypothetical protein [Candidatus Methylomirabilis sp.]